MVFKGNLGYELEITVKGDLRPPPTPVPQPVSVQTIAWVVLGGLVVTAGIAALAPGIIAVATAGIVEASQSALEWSAAVALLNRAAVFAH